MAFTGKVFSQGCLRGALAVSTFVSVGNATQPFPRLLQAVSALAQSLPQPVLVQYGATDGFSSQYCQSTAFVSMEEFAQHVADASLLILHAGAGSIIHAVRAGKVPVVVPRQAVLGEHVDDHQAEFARELARLGRIVLCEDTSLLATAVADALRLQSAAAVQVQELPLVGRIRTLLQEHQVRFTGK